MVLVSGDDFYLLSSGLVVMETTNSIYDTSLYKLLKPQSLLAWMRVAIANRMSRSAKEWVDVFSNYNSGTYNNQWIVLDAKRVSTSRNSIGDDALWIAEQIPGYIHADDVTPKLRSWGYWPSYNVPYFTDIYDKSGYPAFVDKMGGCASPTDGGCEYVWANCSRAQIFARDAPTVAAMKDMQQLMQSNDYKNDPLSNGDPSHAIASRFDLMAEHPSMAGGVDSKISSVNMLEGRKAMCISGPTYQSLPPFEWSEFPQQAHSGQPFKFEFPWVLMEPFSQEESF
jgi:hypothetical protein